MHSCHAISHSHHFGYHPHRMTLIKCLMPHHFIQIIYPHLAKWSENYLDLMQHPNPIKTIWLPAEISQNPLHHSRRGTRQGGAFGPPGPNPRRLWCNGSREISAGSQIIFLWFGCDNKSIKNHLAK